MRIKLVRVAKSILKHNLDVGKNDDILIVCDEQRLKIADALATAADELNARASIFIITDNFRKSKTVRKALMSVGLMNMIEYMDVIILCLANIVSELNFRRIFLRSIRRFPVRVANLPGITEETFEIIGKVPRFKDLEKIGNEVACLLANGKQVRVTSPAGTDISFEVYGWTIPPEISSGYLHQPSTWGNLPGAEVYVVPVAWSAQGKIVIDITMDPDYRLKEPLCFEVKDGRVDPDSVESADEKAKKLLNKVLKRRNGDAICEFGIGLNPNLRVATGITLIDEKMYGTAHFALGDNIEFGGNIRSSVHCDMVFSKPSIWIDNQLIMENGKFKYTQKQLKNTYKDFKGLISEETMVRPTPWATCVRLNRGLARLWRGGANRVHAYRLGDKETSELAEKIWTAIRYGGSKIKEISLSSGIDVDIVKKIVEFLVFHRVLEIQPPEETEKVEELAKKKQYEEKIELL